MQTRRGEEKKPGGERPKRFCRLGGQQRSPASCVCCCCVVKAPSLHSTALCTALPSLWPHVQSAVEPSQAGAAAALQPLTGREEAAPAEKRERTRQRRVVCRCPQLTPHSSALIYVVFIVCLSLSIVPAAPVSVACALRVHRERKGEIKRKRERGICKDCVALWRSVFPSPFPSLSLSLRFLLSCCRSREKEHRPVRPRSRLPSLSLSKQQRQRKGGGALEHLSFSPAFTSRAFSSLSPIDRSSATPRALQRERERECVCVCVCACVKETQRGKDSRRRSGVSPATHTHS